MSLRISAKCFRLKEISIKMIFLKQQIKPPYIYYGASCKIMQNISGLKMVENNGLQLTTE